MRRIVQGQSMVEMALIIPLLVVFTMAIIDFGYYVFTYAELENATRRASEFASKAAPNNAACREIARADAVKNFVLSDPTISFSFSYPNGRQTDRPVVVGLSYTGRFMTPVARGAFGPTFSFTFESRRTILSTAPLLDANNNTISCS